MTTYTRIACSVALVALLGCDAPGDEPPTPLAAPLESAEGPVPPRFTYIACLTDTHVVEEDGVPAENLRKLGATLSSIPYELAGIFVAGDVVFHPQYQTLEEYHADPNDRFDIVDTIFAAFPAPVYPAIGNHDLELTTFDPAVTRQLFREHFDVEPYYAVDLGTWKVIVLDNFQGPTMDPTSPTYDVQSGTLGAAQTAWLEAELADGRPTILMVHFPLLLMQDLPAIAAAHADTVRVVLTGHSHAWVNLADNYGVPSLILGSSQFDADSFLVMELDNVLKTWRILDWERFHWGTSYALPWDAME